MPELHLPADHGIRFVFPHAPERPVTINSGVVMRAWYDIVSPQIDFQQDEAGIRHAQQLLNSLIEREISRGVNSEQIVLAGFSQGGAVALHTGLRYSQPLAGIMALSSYLPLANTLADERHEANRSIPVFMAHGTHDPVVPYDLAEDSKYFMQQQGYQIEWHAYPMQHSVHPEEIDAIAAWLRKIFKI